MRYASNHEDAVEILNDGFVKVFKAIINFIEPEDKTVLNKVFMSWFKIIIINTGINYCKAAARRISWTAPGEQTNQVFYIDQSAENKMAYENLVKLIQRLSPSYRNTFNLYVIEGYKHEEIATMLGISVGTSKSNLLKARKNLRKMLEKIQAAKCWNYG